MLGRLILTLCVAGALAQTREVRVAETCPEVDFVNATLLPHESDCTKFYYCEFGVPVEFDCPDGLEFNVNLKVCDWPHNAKCSAAGVTRPPKPTPPPGPGAPNCPAIDGVNATLLPHESDCTKFYYCEFGTPVVFDCPKGLHFNPELSVCDWPDKAGCESSKPPSTSCPLTGKPTLLSHESDCTKFYMCKNGQLSLHKCPEDNHFNEKLQRCHWEPNAECGGTVPTPKPTQSPPINPPVSCPAVDGVNATLLPHESDCSKFYYCEFGTPVEFDCPAGLHFNPTLSVCDWPNSAGCTTGGSTTTTQKTTSPSTEGTPSSTSNGETTPKGSCPAIDGVNATLLPHESDCSKFYYCVFGTPVEFDCPAGLHFNPTLSVCDWPNSAGCTTGGSTTTTQKTTSPSTEGTPSSTSNGETTPKGSCPAIDGVNATLLPHESDCSKFYYCEFGTPVEFDCPAGLHFNPTLSVCDWPNSAGCTTGGSTTTTQKTTSPSTEGTPSSTSNGETTPKGSCPAIDGVNATLLPHESDCSKFYYCVFGTPVEFDCPAGLHFNPTLSVCDWPNSAGCTTGGSTTTTQKTTSPSTEGTPSSTSNGETTPKGSCPAIDGVNATLLPHESDCSKFYYCVFGTPVEFDCPAGLHFNPTLSVCDWPNSAGCTTGGSTTTTQKTTSPSTEGTPSSTSNGETTPKGSCPAIDGVNATLLPHESDCSKFYYCEFGTPVEFDCPAGLHFNPTLSVCDWPNSAGCTTGGSTTTTQKTTSPSTEGTPSSTSNGETTPKGSCPAIDGVNATLLPHESDCSKFYYCVFGTPVEFDCPAGLHFNPTLSVCDWPNSAGCTTGGSTTTTQKTTSPSTEGTPSSTSNGETTPKGSCPAIDGVNATLLPHESDCSKFYYCVFGTPVEFDCPAGLHFNPTLSVCDWPNSAGCTTGGSTTTTQKTTSPSTEGTPSSTSNGETTPKGSCPAIDGVNATLLPHESDCSKFYYCEFGTPVEFDCPAGLHFNPTLSVCDWPNSAGCTTGGSTTTTQKTTSPSTEGTPSSTSNGETTPKGSCPAIDGVNATLLPHESDCSKFYYCVFGTPVEFDCPAGLHFNPTLSVCDWPNSAGCINDGPITTTQTPTTDELVDEICSNCDLNTRYWGDTKNCRKYWFCVSGKRQSALCPPGLLFDGKIKMCNLFSMVKC
ncbi:uncharacterized protein LOC143913055 isoform X3 [Arctopsyche grandis]|uniref:uncharacterized protein LOC143913055 isoform X3 n=1 Tax=Arctopsyche grandis TaxID=121162 RepID=UPI00406D7F63